MAVRGAKAKVHRNAPAPLLKHGVEAGAIAVAVKGMQHVEPASSWSLQRAAPQAKALFGLVAYENAICRNVPIEHDVARANEGQSATLRIAHRAMADAAACKSVLHHGEADQHHDQHKPADQSGRYKIAGQGARHRKASRRQPHQQQEPCRDQHDGALDAVQGQIKHQRKAGARNGGQRNARHACGHRRIEHGQRHQRHKEHQPYGRDMGGAHMPAIEVEIGEQKHQKRRRKNCFRARTPDAVGLALNAKQLVPEAKVDAHISQHRPCESGGRRKNHRALHDKDDGQEQRQQAGYADHDAFVEREVGDFVFVGIGLPQINLRQVRRSQFGDIGDCGTRIERQAEHICVRAVFAIRRCALAGGDGGDARGAQIRPDDARAR